VADYVGIENRAGLARVTCGWKRPELSIDAVRLYWRDAHSPAIARRDGLYEYRHFQFDSVKPDVFALVPGVDYACDPKAQLMWVSDVRYRDQAGLDAFGLSPDGDVRAQILADIELIVDKSTTYLVVGQNGRTLADTTGDPAPQGPVPTPTFSIFFRQRGEPADFRALVTLMAQKWSKTSGVKRVRLSLFEAPDMEAERKAGYPVKTHPVEQQYQAWIDLVVESDAVARTLISPADGIDYAANIAEIHAYPTRVVYTSNYAGKPTIVGLRGYPAYEAIRSLGAEHQKDRRLLQWMYGAPAKDFAPA
jgi:hypothetical protein